MWKHVWKELNWYINVFYHIVFLEICKSFNLMPKGLEAKKRFCIRGDVWRFSEEMGCNFSWNGKTMLELTARGTLWTIILFNGQFSGSNCWCKCKSNWIFKLKAEAILIRLRRNKKKLSEKSCLEIQWAPPSFSIQIRLCFVLGSSVSRFWNLYALLTFNKTDKYQERENATSQSYQDGINLPEYLYREEKSNDIVDGRGGLSEAAKKLDNHQHSNTASLNKTRLEGEFVSKNVVNL